MDKVKGDSGQRIAEMIKKAMDDHQITTTEYERIMMIADEDGVIDDFDMVKMGNTRPKWFGGLTSALTYKSFKL